MKAWDSDLEEEGEGGKKETSNGTSGKGEESERGDTTDAQGHLQKVQKLIYAAKVHIPVYVGVVHSSEVKSSFSNPFLK